MPAMSKEMWAGAAAATVIAVGILSTAMHIVGDETETPKTSSKSKKKGKKSEASKEPASPAKTQETEPAKAQSVELTEEEEQHIDMEAAIEETLKQILADKPDVIAEYTRQIQACDALRKAGKPKEEIEKAAGAAASFFQSLLQPSPPEVQAAVMQKVQEHFQVRQQARATARAQEEKNKKLQEATKEHFQRVLAEAPGKYAELEPIFDRMQAAKKAGEKIKARQAKKDIKALVVDAVGEEKFQEVQKATRIAKITTVKSMIDEQLDEKIVNNDILKIQMLLKESPDDVKAKITEWAQKMNVDELMKAVEGIMTPELRATLDKAVATVLEQSKISNYEKTGGSLTQQFTVDVNDEVLTMEHNKAMDEREEAIEKAGTDAGKEACRLQLKKFKEALPNDLKEQKRALLDAIYLEIEENLPGVTVQQPDEDANAIRGVRGDMRKLMTELDQAKALLLAAHTRILKSEGVLDKLPKGSKDKHNESYAAAQTEVRDADNKLQEVRAFAAATPEQAMPSPEPSWAGVVASGSETDSKETLAASEDTPEVPAVDEHSEDNSEEEDNEA